MRACIECARPIDATLKRCEKHARPGNRRGATTAERGYGATTIDAIAEAAGSRSQTVVIRLATCAFFAATATAGEGIPRGERVASRTPRAPNDPCRFPREKATPENVTKK